MSLCTCCPSPAMWCRILLLMFETLCWTCKRKQRHAAVKGSGATRMRHSMLWDQSH